MYFFVATWLALAAIAASIYEVALLLGAEKIGALTACLLSLSFPVVLLQTYSYQGDAFVSSLILCSIYFLLRFYKGKKEQDLYVSILALVVSLGSKQTAYLFVPVYFLALLLMLRKTSPVGVFVKALVLGLVFFGIFSSFKVIQNQQETAVENVHMISPGYVGQLRNMAHKPFEGYLINGLRYLYQAISLDGLNGQLKLNLETAKETSFRNFSEKIGIDLESRKYLPEYEEGFFQYNFDWAVSEDSSWFGPFSYSVLPLAMIFTLIRIKNPLQKWYLLFSFILLLIFIFGQVVLKGDGWGAYRGRHMTIAALALAPLFNSVIPQKRILGNLISIILSLAAFFLSLSILLINDNRPIITTRSLYTFHARNVTPVKVKGFLTAQYVSRSEKVINSLLLTSPNRTNILDGDYYDRLFYQDTSKLETINFVNKNIPPKEALYTYMEPSLLEYALFGINRSRDLYPLETPQDLPFMNCALISSRLLEEVPASFSRLDQNDEYSIYCND